MAKMRANKTDLEFPAPSLGLIHDDQCSYFLLEDVLQCEKLHPEYIGNVSAEDLGLPDAPFKDVPFTKSPPPKAAAHLSPLLTKRTGEIVTSFKTLNHDLKFQTAFAETILSLPLTLTAQSAPQNWQPFL